MAMWVNFVYTIRFVHFIYSAVLLFANSFAVFCPLYFFALSLCFSNEAWSLMWNSSIERAQVSEPFRRAEMYCLLHSNTSLYFIYSESLEGLLSRWTWPLHDHVCGATWCVFPSVWFFSLLWYPPSELPFAPTHPQPINISQSRQPRHKFKWPWEASCFFPTSLHFTFYTN